MTVIKYKPITPGKRHAVKIVNFNLYKGRPYYKLLFKKIKTGGRNNLGRITVRHIGGGHKRLYRKIDFKRNKFNILGKVVRFEYDPNRSSIIALILYSDGERRYILAPKGLQIGDKILSGLRVPIQIGNSLPLNNIPIGSNIHNIESRPGKGGQYVRSAGSSAQLISRDNKYVTVRLRSSEIRKFFINCYATLGEVGNSEHMLCFFGKAGVSRLKGIRPTVRGTAMNPIDHPHGGGEGRNFGKHPVSPWGLQTKGKKTRHNKRTDKYIIRRRVK
ncbi:50S ribosomal protein L2 [Candidatus Purcelliella pentastirinorum]|uniref:50S ribosomal protein L2 n=1 Tax=Candidatus Purcelliella pentastirinorum TaxID=472834 RepID=UPI002367A4CF|nr:50S ribosomal protein L2 [Candidatus Purcelliella pentastirinorum]WDI79132.1 50S ribosomal protein L2 [Candidatus Purcelliella pentastirinorum]WDR80271.1 50S ribosomal protein L2 [Candidatus Purcelliella pentastirinorum]